MGRHLPAPYKRRAAQRASMRKFEGASASVGLRGFPIGHLTPPTRSRGSILRLLRLDTSGLDKRPPFRDLCCVIRGEGLGCLLIAGGNLLAQIGKSLPHCRIGKTLDYSGVELRD